jgi:DNA topoisomerase I
VRLRHADCSQAGFKRRGRGQGFEYFDAAGEPLRDPEALERIRALRIPPAWRDVWICPDSRGHLQATGIDAAGRKQYLYHERWRARRDREKFDEMLDFARALPDLRARVDRDLGLGGMRRERVLACAVRLLDRGFFRIGSEGYAEDNGSYGLATMRREHVHLARDGVLTFDYPAKGGLRRVQSLLDPEAYAVVAALKRRRTGQELLGFRRGRTWIDVRSGDINAYIKEATGGDFSAKDFRTWNATVLAAVAIAVYGRQAASPTARKRIAEHARKGVARSLGNTPAVCRASYVDPRVIDRFNAGITIGGVVDGLGDEPGSRLQAEIEEAVIALLEGDFAAEAVERVPAAA